MKKLATLLFLLILVIPGSFCYAQTAEPGDEIYEFVAVDVKPTIQSDASPVYPEAAIDAGVEGSVVVTVVIDKNGNVSEAEIFRSVPELDAAALDAARRKKFSPGMIGGTAVNTRMNIPIEFSLDSVPAPAPAPAQQSATAAAGPAGDVVDLSGAAVVIKAEPDRPRVNIISDRIKPRFDNINLDKSFVPELKGEGEHIVIRKIEPVEEFETVEIKQLVNKSR